MERMIRNATLADWLGFTPGTLRRWSLQGRLDERRLAYETHRSEGSVNKLLAEACERGGLAPPITVADFLNGTRLLTSQQAADMLKTHQQTLLTQKLLRGLLFEREWRFTLEEVWNCIANRNDYLVRGDLRHIFGCSETCIGRWKTSGKLLPAEAPSSANRQFDYYKQSDIARVIGECLPPGRKGARWINRWLFEASVSKRLPMSAVEAGTYLGISKSGLEELVDNGELFYITLGDGALANRRFSPVSVEAALLRQPQLTPEDITVIVGGHPFEVQKWLSGPLRCRIHNHFKLEHRPACMTNILEPLLSPGVVPRQWLRGRRRGTPAPLISAQEVARRYKVPIEHIELAARTGVLGGLLRPDGVWVFSESRVRHLRAAVMKWLSTQP